MQTNSIPIFLLNSSATKPQKPHLFQCLGSPCQPFRQHKVYSFLPPPPHTHTKKNHFSFSSIKEDYQKKFKKQINKLNLIIRKLGILKLRVQEKERGVPVEKWRRKAALALLMLLGCWRSLLKSEEEAVRALLHRAIFFPVLRRDLCF